MAKRRNPFHRIRLVYRRTSTPVKCMILAAILVSTITLLGLTGEIRNAKAAAEANRIEAAELEKKNEELTEDIDALGSVDSDKQIAEEELGLVDPNTVVFTPEN